MVRKNKQSFQIYIFLVLPIFSGEENSPTMVAGKPPSGEIIAPFDPGISNFVRD
jgi:hypothetical protein